MTMSGTGLNTSRRSNLPGLVVTGLIFAAALAASSQLSAQVAIPFSTTFEGATPLANFTVSSGINAQVVPAAGAGIGSSQALSFESLNGTSYPSNSVVDDLANWSFTAGSPPPADYVNSVAIELDAPLVTSMNVAFSYRIINSNPGLDRNCNLVLEYSDDDGASWVNAAGPGTNFQSTFYRTVTAGTNFVNESFTITGLAGTQDSVWLRFRSMVRQPLPGNQILVDNFSANSVLQTPMATALPAGQQTIAYSATLQAAGGVAPYTFSVATGSVLPNGLQLVNNAGTWTIASTGAGPTVGNYAFTLDITDSAGIPATIQKAFTLSIAASPPALTITTLRTLPSAPVNTAYSTTLSANGGVPPYSWTLDAGAPAWLSLSPTTGELTSLSVADPIGTNASFDITVTDARGASFQYTDAFTLEVVARIDVQLGFRSLDPAFTARTYTDFIQAEGGEGQYTYSVADPTGSPLPPGLFIEPNTGEVRGAPLIGTNQSYNFGILISDVNFGGSQEVVIPHTLLVNDGGASPLNVVTSSLPAAKEGDAYNFQLIGAGGTPPYTFSALGTLPSGMTMNTFGRITGTPQIGTHGVRTVQVQLRDNALVTVTRAIDLTVEELIFPLQIATTALPNGSVATFYASNLNATGGVGPYTWTVINPQNLPPNLTVETNGIVSGMPQVTAIDTPGVAKQFTFDVQVSDSQTPAAVTNGVVTITIDPSGRGPLQIFTAAMPSGRVGEQYSFTIQSSGGALAQTWSLAPGSSALPNGLNISSGGTVTGTPEVNSNADYFITFRVDDTAGDFDEETLQLVIQPPVTSGGGGGGGVITTPPALDSGGGCSLASGSSAGIWLLLLAMLAGATLTMQAARRQE